MKHFYLGLLFVCILSTAYASALTLTSDYDKKIKYFNFGKADLICYYAVQGEPLTYIEAFSNSVNMMIYKLTYSFESLRWLAYGVPLPTSNRTASFELDLNYAPLEATTIGFEDGFSVFVDLLPEWQKLLFVEAVFEKYNVSVAIKQILTLPPSKFECVAQVESRKIFGTVRQLSRSPLQVDFNQTVNCNQTVEISCVYSLAGVNMTKHVRFSTKVLSKPVRLDERISQLEAENEFLKLNVSQLQRNHQSLEKRLSLVEAIVQPLKYSKMSRMSLSEHTSTVNALVVSREGLLISASNDTLIKIWHLQSGLCLRTLTSHADSVSSLVISQTGQIISGSWDRTIKIWDMESGECLKTLSGHTSQVNSLAISNEGLLVSGAADGSIKVWDIESGKCLRTISGHRTGINSLVVNENSDRYISVSAEDSAIKVWDLQSGELVQEITANVNNISIVAVSQKKQLIGGSLDKTIQVWNMSSGEWLKTLTGHRDKVISLVSYEHTGWLVSGSTDQSFRIWDLTTGQTLRTQSIDQSLTSLAISQEYYLISGSSSGDITVWF